MLSHFCLKKSDRDVTIIWLSEKFLSFYEEIIDAQRLLFYIILSNYVRSILFCRDKHRDISQTCFHVCMKVHCCEKHVCERKTLFGQPNTKNSRVYVIIGKITFLILLIAVSFIVPVLIRKNRGTCRFFLTFYDSLQLQDSFGTGFRCFLTISEKELWYTIIQSYIFMGLGRINFSRF